MCNKRHSAYPWGTQQHEQTNTSLPTKKNTFWISDFNIDMIATMVWYCVLWSITSISGNKTKSQPPLINQPHHQNTWCTVCHQTIIQRDGWLCWCMLPVQVLVSAAGWCVMSAGARAGESVSDGAWAYRSRFVWGSTIFIPTRLRSTSWSVSHHSDLQLIMKVPTQLCNSGCMCLIMHACRHAWENN